MKQPKVSIIVVYNSENNLRDCLKSLIRQSFSDIEIICVSNSAEENAQKIVQNTALTDERIKLINLPLNNDENIAKQAGLGIAGGDYICFVNSKNVVSVDFIKDLYFSLTVFKNIEIKENHLYRRAFLENDDELSQLIQDKVKSQLQQYSDIINEQKNAIKQEFDKFYRINSESLKSNNYEIDLRLNQLEKTIYEKEKLYCEKLKNLADITETKMSYDENAKIYDYINSEINKKGCEINKIYQEITKNYNYTENLVEKKYSQYLENMKNENCDIQNKINELKKETELHYINIKHILDMEIEKILSGGGKCDVSNNLTSENINKIFSRLDKVSSMFYEELSKISNELINIKNENKNYTELKIQELKNELNK